MDCGRPSATLLAERGASEKQLNAFFGWADSSNESRRYTRAAQQKVLARGAIDLFRERSGNVRLSQSGYPPLSQRQKS